MKLTLTHAIVAIVLALSLAAAPVAAGPFEDAIAAYESGDYATALRLLRPFAEQGNAAAQFNLGSMYHEGHGVPQDYISAHMWLNLAAASGEQRGAQRRDAVARSMTPAQIAEAQKLAREWKPTTQPPR
jgi:TPR repeat protein